MNAARALVIAVVALIVGLIGYQIGIAQNVAQTVGVLAPGVAPVAYYGYPLYHLGFGFLGFLFPILFLFLIFSLIRGAMWGGRGWKGGYGQHGWGDPRARLEDWHKEAHGEKPTSGGPSSGTST